MKTVYVLVGNVASGKSTYIKTSGLDGAVISKDDFRKHFGHFKGVGYLYDTNTELYIDKIAEAYFNCYCKIGVENIFIDDTNMTYYDRSFYKYNAKDYGYGVVAVVFEDCGEDEHVKRRMNAVGDHHHGGVSEETWRKVYREKRQRYEKPTLDEGFDEIIYL